MSDPGTSPSRPDTGATIAIYDRPPWWRRRRVWMMALPAAVSLASLVLYVWLA